MRLSHHNSVMEYNDMTKNLKNYAAVRSSLVRLEAQLKSETKSDPRLRRGHGRVVHLLALLDGAVDKYEIVHGRKRRALKTTASSARRSRS